MGTAVAKTDRNTSLLQKIGNRYSLDPAKVYDTLCKTAFRDAQNQEQVIALLVVADQYKLNPFTREIYAFPAKGGGVVPIVGIDGWLRIINDHPQYDGMEFRESDERTTVGKSKPAPEWMECIIYRKDRSHPAVMREYLEEVYRSTDPWNQTTTRMLRHRCIMQCARVAFGFGGIVDPNDAEFAAEFEGMPVIEAQAIALLGSKGWKQLIKAAKQHGYSEADVTATAATAGYEGPGTDMPADLADRLFESMKAHPKVTAEPATPTPELADGPSDDAPLVDPETGEVIPDDVGDIPGGYSTPMVGGEA